MEIYMKLILVLMLLMTQSLFAQDNYHSEEPPKCQRETCLIVDGSEIGFYDFETEDGYIYLRINSGSSLSDMSFNKSCFIGNPNEVEQIIESLMGNTNKDYYMNGGHEEIISIDFSLTTKKEVNFNYTSKSDYSSNVEKFFIKVEKCK